MAVDPQGENSKGLQINPITAAGGNSSAARRARVKSQLRDRYGRWVEMGRDSKVKIKFKGKVIDVIGKFVGGSDREGYGRFLVKNDPSGVPDGVYHFKGAALNQILASLDPTYLKDKGIKLDRDINGNLIGDVLDKDIEDFDSIKKESIGEVDIALADGELDADEKSEEALVRQKAKAYISKNVVATLDEASKDDVAEGARVVQEALQSPPPAGEELGEPDVKFEDFIDDNGGYLESAKRLLEKNPSNSKSLKESIGFIEKNGYQVEDDRDTIRDSFDELKKSGNLPEKKQALSDEQKADALAKVDKMAEVFTEAYPPNQYDDGTKLQKIIQDLKDAVQNGSSAELGRAARKLRDKAAGDNRTQPKRQEAWNLASDFIKDYGINPQRPEDEKARLDVAVANARGKAEREKFDKYVEDNGGYLETAKKLLEKNPSNSDSLRDSIGFIETNKRADEEDRDAIYDAYKELQKSNNLPGKEKTPDDFDVFVEGNGGYLEAAKKLSEENPHVADSLKESIGFIERTGRADEDDVDAIYYAFQSAKSRNNGVAEVLKKISDATGIDLNNPESDIDEQMLDAVLHTADLIEKYVSPNQATRKPDLYNRLAERLIEHANNLKNGVAGGRKKFAGKADTIEKITERKEGSTLDPFTLSQPRKGIAVALDGRNEEHIDTLFFDEKLGDLLLADYIDKNKDKFDGTFKLGTWHDKANNEVTLDVIELFPEANGEEAFDAGQKRNQQGIFKLSNKEYIDTGGTGDRGRARRQREQARGATGLRPVGESGRLESTKPAGEGGESVLPERANSSKSPELAAIRPREVRKPDTEYEPVDSVELTGNRTKDALALLKAGRDVMLRDLSEEDTREKFATLFDDIEQKFNNAKDIYDVDEAINLLGKTSLDLFNTLWRQPGGIGYVEGWGTPEYTDATEVSKGIYWWASSVSNRPFPAEVADGMDVLLPEIQKIPDRIRPGTKEHQTLQKIIENLENLDGYKGPEGYLAGGVLSQLDNLHSLLSRMVMQGYHNIDNDDFDDEEWIDLKPIRDRISNFRNAALKGWKPEDYLFTTVKPEPADLATFNSKVAEEILPEIEGNDEPWANNIRSAFENGGDVMGAIVDGIDAINPEGLEVGDRVRVRGEGNKIYEVAEKSSPVKEGEWIVRRPDGSMMSVSPETLKLVESMQRVVNSNKRYKKAYRPNVSRTQNSKNSEEVLPENPGSAENPNIEPESEADNVVLGDAEKEPTLDELKEIYKNIGIQRAGQLELNTRTIDRSKLSERQKKVLRTMIAQRNKALKALEYSSAYRNVEEYERNYLYALATTNAIKRLIGNAEAYGENYNFGSGEEERAQNFLVIKDSIKMGTRTLWNGKTINEVSFMQGYYTSKSGKTYLMTWNGTRSTAYTIDPSGRGKTEAGFVSINMRSEDSNGPEFGRASTPGYLKTNRRFAADGIGGANCAFASLALAMAGERFSHSASLTPEGANNSKGIHPNDPEKHWLGQQEKVLQLMGSPSIQLMEKLGFYSGELFQFNIYGGGASFGNFLTPLKMKDPVHGSGSFVGALHTHDEALRNVFYDARKKAQEHKADNSLPNPEAGKDYPAFLEEHIRSDSGNYSSWSLLHTFKELSYKDGISKKDAIKSLKDRQKQLSEFRQTLPEVNENSDRSERHKNAVIDQYLKSMDRLIKGLEEDTDFDNRRIDRPKPFSIDSFKQVEQKPYSQEGSPEEKENPFDFGFMANINDFRSKYKAFAGNSSYEEKYGTPPPDSYTNYPAVLAIRHTSEELKDAIRSSFMGDKIEMDTALAWGVSLDHRRDFAEEPQMADVQLASALKALDLQGVDAVKFFADLVDEKNGNKDLAEKYERQNLGKTSLLAEMDLALKKAGVRKTQTKKIQERAETTGAKGKYEEVEGQGKVLGADRLGARSWNSASMMLNDRPNVQDAPLIDNEKFDYSDGREDVLGGESRQNNFRRLDLESGLGDFATSNPAYFAHNFSKEALVKAFEDALAEERDFVKVQFFSDSFADIPLSSIRDALQYQNVDTNALARNVFKDRVSRAQRDDALKPSGRIVPRSAEEVIAHATTAIDIANFTKLNEYVGGINSPEVYEDPATGKKYLVKRLFGSLENGGKRAADQEIATQAFFRAMGVNASAPQRGFDSNSGQENLVVSEWINGHPTMRYGNEIENTHPDHDKTKIAIADTIVSELFLDQIDGSFNPGNVILDENGNVVRIDGGGGLLFDPVPSEGPKSLTDRYRYGGFESGVSQEQQDLLLIARDRGSFEGDGIEFGFDFYLNPNGWHWNVGTTTRKRILAKATEDSLKNQAREFLLENMTPDKISKITTIIRSPEDRARVTEALVHRRKRILEHFGIQDTYDPSTVDLSTRVPYSHQIDEIEDLIVSIDDITMGYGWEKDAKEVGLDQYESPDFNAGKASQLIENLKNLKSRLSQMSRDEIRWRAEDEEREREEKEEKTLEEKIAEATPDDSDFPTNGESSATSHPVVEDEAFARRLMPGDVLLNDDGTIAGRVLFNKRTPEGKTYIGGIDEERNFFEKTYDFMDIVKIDVGENYTGQIPESDIPGYAGRTTQQQIQYATRLRARSNAVMNEIKQKFPQAKVLPSGDLIVASSTKTEPTRLRRTFRYDVVVHRKPNEKFVSYVRRTQLDENGNPMGDVTVGRISPETHSARHLNNRITPLLGGGRTKGILADFPQNWFNNSNDLQREVIHPGTKQPIPVSLAPRNWSFVQYIGNTGIEETGDPIKDALISHVADLVDRAVSTQDIARRLNNQSLLSRSQVLDIVDRIQANRLYPGVNQVPYVSRDNVNIVRVGDAVRHYHPDGTTREGIVIGRTPLMVYQKAPGEYAYTDVLRVRFNDGTRSPIVAKNLEILRRVDGSTPELSPRAEARRRTRRVDEPYANPSGLVSGFKVRDTESTRSFKHSTEPLKHSQGKIYKVEGRNVAGGRDESSDSYAVAVWKRGSNPDRDLPTRSRTFTDKNIAQEWLIAVMNKFEAGQSKPKNTPQAPQAPQAPRRGGDDELPDPEIGLPEPEPSRFSNVGVVFEEQPDGSTIVRTTGKVEGLEESDLPSFKISRDKKKEREVLTVYPNAKALAEGKGFSVPTDKSLSREQLKEKMLEEARRELNYKVTGPHKVLGIELSYEDFRHVMDSPVSSKYFRDPAEGVPIISAERLEEYEKILAERVPETLKPRKGGKPRIFFAGGGPGAGKSGLSKRDGDKVPSREDDPTGFKRHLVPTFVEYDERGVEKPREFEGDPEAVMINPDDFKLALKEAMSMNFRVRHSKDGSVEKQGGDEMWAAAVHEESSLLAKIALKRASERGLDIFYDGTGNNSVDKMRKKIQEVKNNNPDYETIGLYMNTDPVLAVARAVLRAEGSGRVVDEDVQLGTFIALASMLSARRADGTPNENVLSGLFDEFVLFDNRRTPAGAPPEVLGYSKDGGDFVVNTENPLAVATIATIGELLPDGNVSDDDPRSKASILERLKEQGRQEVAEERTRRRIAARENPDAKTPRVKSTPDAKTTEFANLSTIANATGWSMSQLAANQQVSIMITKGVPIQEIISYVRTVNNAS